MRELVVPGKTHKPKHVLQAGPVESECPYPRRLPVGAESMPGGGTHFRVWAPKAHNLIVELSEPAGSAGAPLQAVPLEREDHGYFSGYIAEAAAGSRYKFRIGGGSYPDPVSRFQPEGPHGPSEIVDPESFTWTDEDWPGVSRRGQVVYELHLGTFTPEGTWSAAMRELPDLKRLGVTLIEVMPVADFPGTFGWGYDGVNLFAPTRLYGRPDDFRAFVDRAHQIGLGIVLDVVYNHFGPDGNYLNNFSDDYFTDRYANEWGQAINFDGPNSSPVREFFSANAAYWISEFHLDGLRLDATQQIFDSSPNHILAAISHRVREAAKGRGTWIVAENEAQETRLARPFEQGGFGLDALWNDDFHHSARVALSGHNEAYYSDYRGTPQEFISAVKWGYLFQGQWFGWQKKRRGSPAFGLAPEQFVNFLQNHDQIANSLRGLRLHQLASPGQCKALTALLLLGPATPMLFQGQEFWASAPFHYFVDHNPKLAKQVAQGRRDLLRQFQTIASPENDPFLTEPASLETFAACKLNHSERKTHREIYEMHRDLLRLRREDPVFSQPRAGRVDGAILGPEAFVLRFFGDKGHDRLLLINLGLDLRLSPAPEPLLAPVEECEWQVKWSSEVPSYGGCGAPALETGNGNWIVLGQAALVLEPRPAA